MKNDYPRKSGNGIFSFLGMGFAIILTIGFLKNNGYELTRSGVSEPSEYGVANMSMEGPVSQPQKTNEITLEVSKSGDYDGRSYDNADAYSTTSSRPKVSKAVRTIANPNEWIERFSSVAVSQAVSRGVPAALSLAVGLQKMERGTDILSWSDFVEKVVDPLAKTKQRAKANIRSNYFKYSANSNLWVEGLEVLGKYSERELQSTMQKHALGSFDKEVREAVMSGTREVDLNTEEKAAFVAEEITYEVRQEKMHRPRKENVAIGRNSADQARAIEEEAYFDELVGREVAREIAKKKIKSGKYIGEEDMDQLIQDTNQETENVVENKLTLLGRKINKKHKDAEKMLDITDKKNAAAREELYQKKLKENKLDSRSRNKHKN